MMKKDQIINLRDMPNGYTGKAIGASGMVFWYSEGFIHREEGPAIIHPDHPTKSEWWLYGIKYTKKQHQHIVNLLNLGYSLDLAEWAALNKSV
jgi:hypothetical protein